MKPEGKYELPGTSYNDQDWAEKLLWHSFVWTENECSYKPFKISDLPSMFPPYLHSGSKLSIWVWVTLYQLTNCGFLTVDSYSTVLEDYCFEIFSLQLRNYFHKKLWLIDWLRQAHSIVSVLLRYLLMLWMSHAWKRSRPGLMGLCATWSNERWPCSWQGGWNKVVFKVFANPNYFVILFQTFMFKG